MNEQINKYIKIFKTNKQLLIPVGALVVVFLYNIAGSFFSISSPYVDDKQGVVVFKSESMDKKIAINANYKMSENEEQRKLVAGEELEVREKAMKNDDFSYMRKQIDTKSNKNTIYIGDKPELEFGKEIKDGKNETLKKNCIKDKITNLIICTNKDGKECIKYNNEIICLDKENCKKMPYNSLNQCSKFLKKEKPKVIEKVRDINERGIQRNSRNKVKETFGLNQNSKEYLKYSMLLRAVNTNEEAIQGFIGQINKPIVNRVKDNQDEIMDNDNKLEKLLIKPGSSYIARLMNPINTLHAQDVRPIIDIVDGDLAGYRMIGTIAFQEASNGLIIKGEELISPSGERMDVEAVAVQFKDGELTPLFADEVDRHLGEKFGYTVLAALTGDYTSMISGNSEKEDNEIAPGDTIISNGGEIVSGTFEDLAAQYVTEVKVNPQTMIIMFY